MIINMKKYINQTIILLIGIVLYSCSQDKLDDINYNVNDPSDVSASLVITDVMIRSAFSVAGSDLAFYAGTYMEHNVGIFGQMYNAETRVAEPTSSSTYNNSWGTLYTNLYNLQDIIQKCSEGGSEEGNFHTLGIAQILTAYNLGVLTDLMGDVPWTEALQPGVIFTPKLDSQESIYTELFKLLDDAITNLEKETDFVPLGKQDVIYGRDNIQFPNTSENWLKMAYGLKARHTMRLSHKSPDYANVIAYADKSFTSAAEQAQLNYISSSNSPFYSFLQDRDYFGASTSLHKKLTDRDDPRDAVFFEPHPKAGDDLLFAINGGNDQAQGKYAISAISKIDAPTYLLSYHEIEFLKAEAYARLDQLENAKTALEKAITAAFGKKNIGLSTAVAKTYFTDKVASKLNSKTNALKEIMVQKYVAFYEEEAIEAYNDYRRLRAMGEGDFIELANPFNGSNKFPLRFTYGSGDVTTNKNVRDAYVDGSYVYTENVWWAGGTR